MTKTDAAVQTLAEINPDVVLEVCFLLDDEVITHIWYLFDGQLHHIYWKLNSLWMCPNGCV